MSNATSYHKLMYHIIKEADNLDVTDTVIVYQAIVEELTDGIKTLKEDAKYDKDVVFYNKTDKEEPSANTERKTAKEILNAKYREIGGYNMDDNHRVAAMEEYAHQEVTFELQAYFKNRIADIDKTLNEQKTSKPYKPSYKYLKEYDDLIGDIMLITNPMRTNDKWIFLLKLQSKITEELHKVEAINKATE